MLSVEHVTKRYGKFTALEDLSLTFTPGVYGLLAPNGAGKTTLIKMLTTLLFPTQGQILWDGEDIQALGETYRAQLGYLPQAFGYYPSYTPRQFLRYAAALQRIPPAEVEGRIADRLKQVGLEEVADQKMRKFSGGMLQRTGIALAILGDPKLLILDEPTVGLDPAQMIEIRSLIHDLGKTHTVILSSHILSEVQTVCDRVLIIAHGKLVAQGTPEELAGKLAAKGTISATAQGERNAVLAAAATVPGLTDLRVTAEKGGEVSFTAVSESGADLRGALSLALAKAGCPVLNLRAESMSLEDVFLQLTEAPEETETTETKTNEQEAE